VNTILRPASIQSLRWRLLRTVSIVSLVIWALTGLLSYLQARHEAEEFLDGHLASSARTLLALVHDNEAQLPDLKERLDGMRRQQHEIYDPQLEFQVGKADGAVLLRSRNAPEIPMRGVAGFIDIERDDQSWRLYNLASPDGDYRIQVAQPMDLREKAALEVAMRTVQPVGIILPLLLLLIYFSIRRGLKPLEALAADVSARTPENLSALTSRAVPLEALPLVAAVNRLMFRLGETLENERRFTADAAHELRTPLAAVKTQAQVALMSQDAQAREHALRQLLSGADRAGRLIEQLLRLARLDPLSSLPDGRAVDLTDLAREVVTDMLDAALIGGRHLDIDAGERPIPIRGDRDLLAVALRNLIDNALRHIPAGGHVTVRVGDADGHVEVSVQDDGPGVPADELPRLGERFHRGRDTRAEGSGLGLTIVRRIAELHGAAVEFRNAPRGGFIARIAWPAGNMDNPPRTI
jgi:two-component system sensor histidine kinase QseC